MRKFLRNLTSYKIEPEEEAEEESAYEEQTDYEEGEEGEEGVEEYEDETGEEREEIEMDDAEASDKNTSATAQDDEDEKEWLGGEYEEGQLSIDVYQTPESIVVKSTIAGVKPDDIDISINNDLLTIRGKREMPEIVNDENYLFRECYWGPFSRSVILPVEIIPEKIDASLENGVLTVLLPKAKASKQISIKVKGK